MCRLTSGRNLMRRVKQRLGGYATAIQANPAKPLLALDEDDFLAQVGSVERRGISARPCAQDYDFSFDGVHIIASSSLLATSASRQAAHSVAEPRESSKNLAR